MKPHYTRLLLVDDHQIVTDSLSLLFSTLRHVEVVGCLNDSRRVDGFLREHKVDMVICDLNMPHFNGIELTIQLKKMHPSVKVLLLTMVEDSHALFDALKAGAHGYVLKRSGRKELEHAINELMEGRHYFAEDITGGFPNVKADLSGDVNPMAYLTDRELDVLKLIADECSTNEIADKLFISVPTVETHRRHLMKKLNVKNVVGMVKYAVRFGLST